jgi:hypothetical protein
LQTLGLFPSLVALAPGTTQFLGELTDTSNRIELLRNKSYCDRNLKVCPAPKATILFIQPPAAFSPDRVEKADSVRLQPGNQIRKSLSGENPIGRQIYCLYDTSQPMTIVGVAGDVHNRGPAEDPMPECYNPYQQHAFGGMNIMVRTSDDPSALAGTLRRPGRAQSPIVSMKFTTMEQDLSETLASPRFRTLLFAMFAALAVLLARPVSMV